MCGRTTASTVAVLLSGAVVGAVVVLLATEPAAYGATAWALLWGSGLMGAFLAGFCARGLSPRSAGARRTAEDPADGAADGVGPMDAAEAAAKAAGRTGAQPNKMNAVRPGRNSAVLGMLAVAVCLGLFGGLWVLWPDDEVERRPESKAPTAPERPAKSTAAWQVPATGNRYDEGPGAWGLGDVVVRGRVDGLFAYRARDGAVRWSLPAPDREAVCAMSPGAEQGVGLIAYGKHDKPCATLVAVRISDGKALWQRPLTGDGLVEGGLAVGGFTAVAAEGSVLRARSTETGEQRWQRVLAKNCEARAVDATATRTLLVEQCGANARLVALDTRTGKEQWIRVLPIESKTTAAVVSVAPVVIAVSEDDPRGTRALLGFDDRGAPAATVPLSGPAGDLVVPEVISSGTGTEGRPLVLGNQLVTLAEQDDLVPDVVVAHSLKDGRKLWEYKAQSLAAYSLARERDGRIGVLADNGAGLVILLDAHGTERGRIEPDDGKGAALSIRPELIPVTGGHVVVNHMSMSGEPGVFGLR
ncbi:PQQ-like beta-propeller repeat protein [Streptomyces sp. ISL-10]|uniref:outer membrane protein assembly factor BamB family protein n=1 Tax=Streptomyces sp. ISL-10 TaxID=2819172 RepID=UPI001BE705C8|nr:PQQ-binding-like beta-propeller repeat protein [Streptomyces sp. ISL-10]MBT2365849.1 PQQ-like beta-propeller repeat protein [Streptomyces sp. ISL-10]